MRNKVTYRSWVFRDPKISVATMGLEQSLPIRSLGINTFDVEVKCTDKSILQFDQNAPIRFFHRKRQMGIYYVQSIIRVDKALYQISSISTLGLLEQRQYMGGIFTGQTVAEVVADICGNIPFVIKSNLRKIKLYGWIPICSGRDALAQVLFAISANLSTDYNGVLHIETLWSGISSVISADRIYADSGNDQQDSPVTSVTVLEHQYIPGTERKDLYSGTTLQGQRIPFDEPCHDLQADGFQIIESGANYAVVSGGSGVLTGIPYVHTTTEVTRAVTVASVANDERIEDATLVSLANSSAVAERMAEYYKHRRTISADVVLELDVPGQVVQIRHPWDNEMVNMMIDTSSVNVDSILKGSITGLVDFAPAQREDLEYYDERVVLTGSGTWQPPEGVTEVRVVAIGGGDGGQSGLMGYYAQIAQQETETDPKWGRRSQFRRMSQGGKGGDAGLGGTGGRIVQDVLHLDGTPISYQCGIGGIGGVANNDHDIDDAKKASVPGGSGSDTVFGLLTTADGQTSDTGYYDTITGERYGGTGETGVPGGDGGGQPADDKTATNNPVPGPDVVYKGVTYHSGPNAAKPVVSKDKYIGAISSSTYLSIACGGWYGAGGGAAAGADGQSTDEDNVYKPVANIIDNAMYAYGGGGGKGGDAVKPDKQPKYGYGGYGGNGGGGVGGYGGVAAEATMTGSGISVPSFPGAVTISGVAPKNNRGAGSDGGDGGDGCIILYYRRPIVVRSGILTDKTNTFLADKTGRLLIV